MNPSASDVPNSSRSEQSNPLRTMQDCRVMVQDSQLCQALQLVVWWTRKPPRAIAPNASKTSFRIADAIAPAPTATAPASTTIDPAKDCISVPLAAWRQGLVAVFLCFRSQHATELGPAASKASGVSCECPGTVDMHSRPASSLPMPQP
jgi:hypothetical protein